MISGFLLLSILLIETSPWTAGTGTDLIRRQSMSDSTYLLASVEIHITSGDFV